MKLNEYQELSKRTYPKKTKKENLSNFALGLTGESGEVADIVKKHLHHGHELESVELLKELGDVMFYIASMCTLLGVEMEMVADMNVEKLERRYVNGFSEKASRERVE